MMRLAGTIAATVLLFASSLLTAQTVTSGNTTATVTVPAAIECSAAMTSSIALTGFDVQNPGFADIMLVLDESGSMASADFVREKNFAISIMNTLMTGTGGARIGVVQFSGDARLSMQLTDNKQSAINQVNSMFQRGGSTCIGCGIAAAQQELQVRGRQQATKFMIVLTDGVNNVNVSTFNGIVTNAKNIGTRLLAIGVGAVDQNQIEFIASDIPGFDTSFLISDFSQLPTILNQLTAAISSPAATNVTVTVDVGPRFPVTGSSRTAGTVQVTGSTVVWTMPALGASTQTMTLQHQHDGAGQGSLQVFAADYSDTQGHAVSIPTPFTTVNGCNTAPVANAGVDQNVDLSGSATAAVTLNGTASTDDGLTQPLTYSWTSGAFTASGATPTLSLPVGTHTFTLTVDDGEFTDTDDMTVVVGDPTAPVVTSSVTGTTGANGWYTSNVDVSFTTSDPETGVASSTGCTAASVSSDTAGQTFTCTATNGAGASTTETVTVKRDATAPTLTTSGPVNAEATSAAGAIVSYAAATATDAPSGVAGSATCAPASGSLFAPGTTMVTCDASDNAGNAASASFAVTVGDHTAPVVGDVTPSISSMSPPNHRMMDVTIAASATDAVSAAACSITNVASSEPDNGLGDGDTANDIVITGPLSVNLRAERSGNGPGRVYTITVTCTDGSGNAASSSTTVSVPKSNGR